MNMELTYSSWGILLCGHHENNFVHGGGDDEGGDCGGNDGGGNDGGDDGGAGDLYGILWEQGETLMLRHYWPRQH